MRKTDLAYAAGIVDGEGCIGLYLQTTQKSKPSYKMGVRVSNTNEWLLQWLKFAFGGSVCVQRVSSVEKAKNYKPQWQWAIITTRALVFLKLIYPYLRLKKPQAEIAITFQQVRRGRGHYLTDEERAVAEAQRIVMANLNKRGTVKIKSDVGEQTAPMRQ